MILAGQLGRHGPSVWYSGIMNARLLLGLGGNLLFALALGGCSLVNAVEEPEPPVGGSGGSAARGGGGSGTAGAGNEGGTGTGTHTGTPTGTTTGTGGAGNEGGGGDGGEGGGPVDAPETAIDSGPDASGCGLDATFTFSADQNGCSFQCRADGAAYAPCSSPHDVPVGSGGGHTFDVYAVNGQGVPDATPAHYDWTIDATAPDTSIDSSPTDPTSSTSASFTFSANEPASFQCSRDGAAWSTCTSPTSYSGLAAGDHSFDVRASDACGNTDASPAAFDWTICAPAGSVQFNPTNATGATGTIQSWVVPNGVCRIRMEAWGAQGGDNGTTLGAYMSGDFTVIPGATLRILVGQRPDGFGGGGGTFIATSANQPLLVAGGGGNCFQTCPSSAETVGRVETSGGTAGATARATGGNGGNVGNTTSGGGGGFFGNGGNATGGLAFVNGGTGGVGEATGGFGGGGARGGLWGQGGGGGYSGGSCGDVADNWYGCGGGGSFNSGTSQSNQAGNHAGAGLAVISWTGACGC